MKAPAGAFSLVVAAITTQSIPADSFVQLLGVYTDALTIEIRLGQQEGSHSVKSRRRHIGASTKLFDATNDDQDLDDLDELLSTVSEAEALLACRSYLQRKNRLDGWSNRRATRQEIIEEAKESDSVGFFWENPDELVYYNRKRRPRYVHLQNTTTTAPIATTFPNALNSSSVSLQSATSFGAKRGQRRRRNFDDTVGLEDVWENVNDLSDDDETSSATYFRIDEETPSNSHIRRSEAAKKRFADPEWKAAWYEKRWGKHRKVTSKEKKDHLMHQRVLPLAGFLSHPELAAMDEEEIVQAIRTYREAGIKRSAGVREATERRRTEFDFPSGTPFDLNTTLLDRDSLFRVKAETLEEQQQKRAEKAKRAYETRLKKQKEETGSLDSKRFVVKGRAPDLAMHRIHNRLSDPGACLSDVSSVQSLREDLRRVMIPSRLSRRTTLLHRMLRDLFDVRGKCIPDGEGGVAFMTNAPIQEVAKLIDQKLCERLRELSLEGTSELQ